MGSGSSRARLEGRGYPGRAVRSVALAVPVPVAVAVRLAFALSVALRLPVAVAGRVLRLLRRRGGGGRDGRLRHGALLRRALRLGRTVRLGALACPWPFAGLRALRPLGRLRLRALRRARVRVA